MIPNLFAVSWVLLLNPQRLINLIVRQIFNLQESPSISTLTGMILVEGLLDLPIALLVTPGHAELLMFPWKNLPKSGGAPICGRCSG